MSLNNAMHTNTQSANKPIYHCWSNDIRRLSGLAQLILLASALICLDKMQMGSAEILGLTDLRGSDQLTPFDKCTGWYLYAFMNKLAIQLWMDGLKLNVILMFFRYDFVIWQPLHRHESRSQNLSTALPACGCHALQRVIGWKLSCTCIVTSWSQRWRPEHGGFTDRWGLTYHANEENLPSKFNINEMKIKRWRPKDSRHVRIFLE